MPRFVYYIFVAVGFVVFFQVIANNFYDEIGYVHDNPVKEQKKTVPQLTLEKIDSLIDKRIAERDTITLEVVSSGFLQSVNQRSGNNGSKTYPTIQEDITSSSSIERVISISNPNLSDQEYFEFLKREYLKEATRNLPEGRARTDMVVRYYKHNADGGGIYKLKELKYYIHERAVSDPGLAKIPSNALFYGDNIKDEDIKIVAYTLMENGIPIKTIEPSQYSKDWKANSIEIGADSSLLDAKALTLGQVRSFIH